jgi:hypothetical protein
MVAKKHLADCITLPWSMRCNLPDVVVRLQTMLALGRLLPGVAATFYAADQQAH